MFSQLCRAVAQEYQSDIRASTAQNQVEQNVRGGSSTDSLVWAEIVRACRKRGSTAGDENAVCASDGRNQEVQSKPRLSGQKRCRSEYEEPRGFRSKKRSKLEQKGREAPKASSLIGIRWKWMSRRISCRQYGFVL